MPSLYPVRYPLPSARRQGASVPAAAWRTHAAQLASSVASRQAVHARGGRPRWTRAVFLLLCARDEFLASCERELAPTCGEPRQREKVHRVWPRVAQFFLFQARDLARCVPYVICTHGAAVQDKSRTLSALFLSRFPLLCLSLAIVADSCTPSPISFVSPLRLTSHKNAGCSPIVTPCVMPPRGLKRAVPAARASAQPKAARLAPPVLPTDADRRNKDELRSAAARAGSMSLLPLDSYAGQVPIAPCTTGMMALGAPPLPPGLSAPQALLAAQPPAGAAASLLPLTAPPPVRPTSLAAAPSALHGALVAAPPTIATPSLPRPGATSLPLLGSQVDVSTDFLTQPDFYLRGVADRMAAYQAQMKLPQLDNQGAGRPPQGPPAGGSCSVRDSMSQPPPFPRPASPPSVRGTPSSSRSPPGMGAVEYEESGQAEAVRPRMASSSAPESAAPPSLPVGRTAAGGTQDFAVDDTQNVEAVRSPPAAGGPGLHSGPRVREPDWSQRRASAPRTARAPRSRKTLASPPTEGTWVASLSLGARSSAGNTARRRGSAPAGAGGSSGTPPARSPAASATQTRRGPPTPGSTMTLNAGSGAPTFVGDEDAVAKSACVRGISASVGALTKRMGTLEGTVSDTGRRLQTQGASMEALARSVSALRSTVQQGFAEMKALTTEQRGSANQRVATPRGGSVARSNDQAPAAETPDDKGFRTGRAIRGANPAALPDDNPAVIMRDISAIRRLINDDLTQRTAWAVTNRDVYLDGDEIFNLMIDKTMDHRKDEADEAEQWLLTPFEKPTSGSRSKKGKDRVERLKPFVPLGQVLPHLIEALKKRGAAAYFNCIKVPLETLTASTALSWYNADEYTKSTEGQRGIKAAMVANYLYLGARGRVEKPRTVGGETIVRCTSGWYALMSSFVRQHLEALIYANIRKPRHVDLSCYASWRVELFRVDSFLSTDKEPHNGMVLADGDDAARIHPTSDKDDMYEKLYSDQVTMAAEAAAMESMAAADADVAADDADASEAVAEEADAVAEEADAVAEEADADAEGEAADADVQPATRADDETERT